MKVSLTKFALILLCTLALIVPVFAQVNIEQPISPDTLSNVRQLLKSVAVSIYDPGTFGHIAVDSGGVDSTLFYEMWSTNTLILNITCDSAMVIRYGGLALKRNNYSVVPIDTLLIEEAAVDTSTRIWTFGASGVKHAYFKFIRTGTGATGDSLIVNDSYIYRSRY